MMGVMNAIQILVMPSIVTTVKQIGKSGRKVKVVENNPVLDTVVLGNCLDVMANMADNSVDLVVTDPPFGIVNRESQGLRNLDKGSADVVTVDINQWLPEVLRVLGDGSFYSFCGLNQISEIYNTLVDNGMAVRFGAWKKTNPSPMNGDKIWLFGLQPIIYGKTRGATFNEHCSTLLFESKVVRGVPHPTPKSVEIVTKLILTSTNEGDIVFDPFMGSGTTALAALSCGRRFYGCDINEDYITLTNERINKVRSWPPQLEMEL